MRKKLSICFLAMALAAGLSTSAFASSSYLTQFRSVYGTGITIDSCSLCHPGGNGSASNLNQYANDFTDPSIGNYTFGTPTAHNTIFEARDSDGDGFTNIAEINARTYPGDPASHPAASDTTPPSVTAFTIPATSSSLTVSITSFTATDNTAVTGYVVTESATAPAASATGWSATAPTSYAASAAGARTLYAWAKDAAGNVSTSRSAPVTITLPGDTTIPSVTSFTIPATSSSLIVSISSFAATDNVGVTGYMVNESSTKPLATAVGWTATAPTSYTASAAGARTLYAWAKDAAGNVSASRSAPVTITLPASDTTLPNVTAFTLPTTSSSLTVSIISFTATDNVAVTGYMVNESATKPLATAAGWTATAPTRYTASAAGARTLYAWAKDAAGNVSTSRSASVTITTGGSIASRIGVFTDGTWYFDMSGTGAWDGPATDMTYPNFGVGLPNVMPVVGDWDGTGVTRIGVFTNGTWYVDMNGSGVWGPGDVMMAYFGVGLPNAIPVVGDWDGTGVTRIGVFTNGTWYLDMNGNGAWDGPVTDMTYPNFGVGLPNAIPVVGRW